MLEPQNDPRGAFHQRGWQDELLEKIDSGVDETLIVESLRRTPTERLDYMAAAARSLDEMKRSLKLTKP